MTFVIMATILFSLILMLLYNAEITEDTSQFFDIQNTTAMRGFWCIIVILVHIPLAYQNKIQDLIGSFAYIGVTFFFMTSAYGLKTGASKNENAIKFFWRRRLPKLLVPMFLGKVLGVLIGLVEGTSVSLIDLISINTWVVWLLCCYLIYWLINRFVSIGGGTRIC